MRLKVWFVAVLLIASVSFAQSTQPTMDEPTRKLIGQLSSAYAKLKTLSLAGSLSFDADVAQQQSHQSAAFEAWFASPNQFRHEIKDDTVLVGTGAKVFSFLVPRNQYMTADEPPQRSADLPAGVSDLLRQQNPALLLALSANAGEMLTDGASAAQKISDLLIAGKSYPAMKLTENDRDVTIAIDPSTGLVRQMQIDLQKLFEQQQTPHVLKAILTIDYPTIAIDPAIDPSKFAFTPPAGATQVEDKPLAAADPQGDDPAQALVAKRAPEIKLENLDGKAVSPLTENKGSVIVLDFWATWCPPCREGLPHLAEIYKNKQSAGLKVFAINLREDKDKVNQFLTEQKLALPVLLDYNGEVAGRYLVNGIPQTVVIAKDGTVRSVQVGFGEDSAEQLAKAVDAAMSAK